MKKLNEGGNWEKEWADAFEHASLQPSDSVWNVIDGSLANKELRKYKKRAAFFQWVAAASVFVSMCGAAWLLTQSGQLESEQTIASQQQEIQQAAEESNSFYAEGEAVEKESQQQTAPESLDQKNLAPKAAAETGAGFLAEAKNGEASSAIVLRESKESNSKKQSTPPSRRVGTGRSYGGLNQMAPAQATEDAPVENGGSAGMLNAEKAGFIFFEQAVASVEAPIQKVWVASDLFIKKEALAAEKFWLGAVLTSSSFNPNFQDNSTSLTHLARSDSDPVKGGLLPTSRVSQWNEEERQQLSINGGVQAAARLGKKWVLQGGVQYGSYHSSAMAGTYVDQNGSQAYPLHYANFSSDKVQHARAGSRLTAPVSALNTFEFISVPLQIGYVVFDRKFSLLVSPGVSSEFFLRNQLSDQENRLSTYTTYSGEDAPFQTVHLKGIVGAQLFYKVSDNYMISLEPSFQHALSDFNKSSSLFESRPSSVGVSAGFRYIIR